MEIKSFNNCETLVEQTNYLINEWQDTHQFNTFPTLIQHNLKHLFSRITQHIKYYEQNNTLYKRLPGRKT